MTDFKTSLTSSEYLATRPHDTLKLMEEIVAGMNPPDFPTIDDKGFSISMVSRGEIKDAYCCVHFQRFDPNVMLYALSEDGDGLGERHHYTNFEDVLARVLQKWW